MRMYRTNGRAGGRPAFTLIELLVVIGIIGLLVALTAGAVFRVMAAQKVKNTEQTVSKVASALDQQWKAVIDQARDETIPPAVLALADYDNIRARVLWTKMRLKQEFPMSFAEALNPFPGYLTAKPAYASQLQGITPSATPTPEETSACLMMALTQARRGMAAFNPEESVGASGVATRTVYGRGFKVFVDSWGTPIVFVRWPMGNSELNAPPYAVQSPSGSIDPQDPEGKLLPNNNWSQANRTAAQQYLHLFINHNVTPFVVSAGADRSFASPGGVNDDIVSFRLRRSGQRGD